MAMRITSMVRACVAVALACVVTSATAMAQAPVGNKYAALFASNQGGGKALTSAIALAAVANPAEAQLIVDMAANGTPEQQAAAAAGLAQAYQIAVNSGNAETAAAIQASVESAGGAMATAFASATGGSTNNDNASRVTPVSSTTTTTTSPVSPAKP